MAEKTLDLIEQLTEQVNNFKEDDVKVLELSPDEYATFKRLASERDFCFHDTGYDQDRKCYVFLGCDVKLITKPQEANNG